MGGGRERERNKFLTPKCERVVYIFKPGNAAKLEKYWIANYSTMSLKQNP